MPLVTTQNSDYLLNRLIDELEHIKVAIDTHNSNTNLHLQRIVEQLQELNDLKPEWRAALTKLGKGLF